MADYIDPDGNVIVLKSIRPIIDYPETILGDKRGARRQFRYGNLHIREYENYYSVHMDTVDPRKDPLGHLVVDAPEYLAGVLGFISIAIRLASARRKKITLKKQPGLLLPSNSILANIITGLIVSKVSYLIINFMKNWTRNNNLK